MTAVVGAELEHEEWLLDPFGRIGQDAVTLPGPVVSLANPANNGSAVPSKAFATYNPMGWKTFVSEATALSNAFGTTYFYYNPKIPGIPVPDPFGRPAVVEAADKKVTQFTYVGSRVVRRSQKVLQQVPVKNGGWGNSEVWATTVEQYDGLGRLREVKDPTGTRTTYTYDAGGRLSSATVHSGSTPQSRGFNYDGRGFLSRETPAESGAVSYLYDARGNVTTKASPAGTVFFTYDGAGRVTQVSTAGAVLRELFYGTAGIDTGKLKQAKAHNFRSEGTCTDFLVKQDYHYDAPGGRLSAMETSLKAGPADGESWTQGYFYDGAGRVTQIDYPRCVAGCVSAARSQVTAYAYGRPIAIPGFADSIRYNENGTLNELRHSNGVVFTQKMDPKGMARPGSLTALPPVSNGTVPLWSEEAYGYDAGGNVTQIGVKRYTYDGASRLTSATLPTAGGQPYQEYAYDGFGNLTRLSRGAGKGSVSSYVDYPADPHTNRLTLEGTNGYDGAGRMLRYSGTTYAWDVLDQMAQVDGTAAGSEAWTHVYDVSGERVWSWRTSSSRVDNYTLRGSGGQVLSLFTKTPGTPSATYNWKDYVYREGQLLGARLSDNTVRHFDVDHLGTVRLETDGNGAKLAYRELWPYGEDATPAVNDEKMRFTGHERDLGVLGNVADDMDYMHARYYRPLLGRFLSVDQGSGRPRAAQSWNRYAYAERNTLKFVDPDGLAIQLAADNDATKLRLFLVRTLRKSTGRSYLSKLAMDKTFTVTFRDVRINSPAAVAAQRDGKSNGRGITAGDTNPLTGTLNGEPIRGATIRLDTAAIEQAHRDRTGVSTTAHETLHGVTAMNGGGYEDLHKQDLPTNETGPAAEFGDKVSAEPNTLTQEQAEALLDELLSGRPPR